MWSMYIMNIIIVGSMESIVGHNQKYQLIIKFFFLWNYICSKMITLENGK